MTTEQVITLDPDIHGGLPVFTGTRVPVKSLNDHLKTGDSLDYFLEGYPSVSRQQAIAFLEIALTTVIQNRDHSYLCQKQSASGHSTRYAQRQPSPKNS